MYREWSVGFLSQRRQDRKGRGGSGDDEWELVVDLRDSGILDFSSRGGAKARRERRPPETVESAFLRLFLSATDDAEFISARDLLKASVCCEKPERRGKDDETN